MAERKRKPKAKGTSKPKAAAKKPAKRAAKKPAKKTRKKAADKRTPEELKADGEAVAKDVAEDPAARPWAHLSEDADGEQVRDKDGKVTGRKPLSALEITKRNSEIFRGWMRGLHPNTLAETYGLQPRRIESIVAEYRKTGVAATTMDPVDLIDEHVLRLDAVVDELAAHAAREKGSGRTAAIRARLEALKARIEFMQRAGLLPHDLGTIGVQIDLRSIGLRIVEALEVRGLATADLLGELADIIDGKQAPDQIIDSTAEEVDEDDEDFESAGELEAAAA